MDGRLGVLGHDGLVLIQPTLADPVLASARLVPVSAHTFRAEDEDGYGVPGASVVFELDADGRARRMRMGENDVEVVDGCW